MSTSPSTNLTSIPLLFCNSHTERTDNIPPLEDFQRNILKLLNSNKLPSNIRWVDSDNNSPSNSSNLSLLVLINNNILVLELMLLKHNKKAAKITVARKIWTDLSLLELVDHVVLSFFDMAPKKKTAVISCLTIFPPLPPLYSKLKPLFTSPIFFLLI